ncbi:MAG: glycosyltransferase family 39 protein [Nocardioidaceae bacterium]
MGLGSRALRAPATPGAAVLAVALTIGSFGYGFDRDELYFRMLRPAWGYVDQPPLTPYLARTLAGIVDQPFFVRIPATVSVVVALWLVVLMARELGASPAAQRIAGLWFAASFAALGLGHVLLTSTIDLMVWQLIVLFVLRALVRDEARWWLWAGLASGLATYNRDLVTWLLLGIVLGLLLAGPRRWLGTWQVWGGAVVAAVAAIPNLVWQARHDWPQAQMAGAPSDNNGSDVRVFMWVFLVIGISPLALPVLARGFRALWARAETRCLPFAFVLTVVLTFVSGAQPHYPIGLMPVLLAAGVREVGLSSRPWYVGLAGAVNAVIALPVIPLGVLGSTPLPDINLLVADQVGWPTYVSQVADVWDGLGPDSQEQAVIVTSNYGEAGAIARFGPARGLPRPFSGQNALFDEGPPPEGTTVVVYVGGQVPYVEDHFASCTVADRLDNGLDVGNEEQGLPIAVCVDPDRPWSQLWPLLQHLD